MSDEKDLETILDEHDLHVKTGAAHIANGISAGDFYTTDYVYPNRRNLATLGNVLTLLPIHIIKKCLVEMDHIYAISNSTNLDLALSITEENKEATLKMLKLRGW